MPRGRPQLEGPITVVPANQASCRDLDAVFGVRGYPAPCRCQLFKVGHWVWGGVPVIQRAARLEAQTRCGDPEASTTSGLVAYLDGEPVGWCAVEPRTAYPRLPRRRAVLVERGEDGDDASVWAATCFVTRAGYRRRGVMRALARAAVPHARERGARALEGYPLITEPGQDVPWGEVHVGTRNIFEEAGLREVYRATLRRVVMRIDF